MTVLSSLYGLPAPAKLNLFLHVIGRRSDGKHLLQSVFILLNLHDTLDICELSENKILRTGDVVGNIENDLCIRAARLIKDTYGLSQGVSIHLKKNIPSGAGMGGGSSDAATVLIALNRLFKLNLNKKELMSLGEKLGADVPFFIWGKPGFVEGIGERISSIEVPQAKYAIIWPGREISTAKIFSSQNLTRDTESMKITSFSEAVRSRWPVLYGKNDLQPVAEKLESEITKSLNFLKRFCEPRMTGSGSAVFGILPPNISSSFLTDNCLPGDWRGFISDSLCEHPLSQWIAE